MLTAPLDRSSHRRWRACDTLRTRWPSDATGERRCAGLAEGEGERSLEWEGEGRRSGGGVVAVIVVWGGRGGGRGCACGCGWGGTPDVIIIIITDNKKTKRIAERRTKHNPKRACYEEKRRRNEYERLRSITEYKYHDVVRVPTCQHAVCNRPRASSSRLESATQTLKVSLPNSHVMPLVWEWREPCEKQFNLGLPSLNLPRSSGRARRSYYVLEAVPTLQLHPIAEDLPSLLQDKIMFFVARGSN